MSIWASADAFDGLGRPIRYQGSHVLPSDDDERAGCLDLAEIPGFISRGDRHLCGPDDECPKPADVCCDRSWPYLRVGLSDGEGSAVVVLDRGQVGALHAYLGRWLTRARGGDV